MLVHARAPRAAFARQTKPAGTCVTGAAATTQALHVVNQALLSQHIEESRGQMDTKAKEAKEAKAGATASESQISRRQCLAR